MRADFHSYQIFWPYAKGTQENLQSPKFIFPVGGDFVNAQKKEADKASFFDLLFFNSAAHHFFQHSLVQLAHAGQDRMNILRQPMA